MRAPPFCGRGWSAQRPPEADTGAAIGRREPGHQYKYNKRKAKHSVTNRPLKPLRPGGYLSAGLWISLAAYAVPAVAENGWNCSAGADGNWQCAAASTTPPLSRTAPLATSRPAAQESHAPAPTTSQRPLAAAVTAQPTRREWDWDWVPLSRANEAEIPAGACCRPGRVCDGVYLEPEADWPDAESQPEQVPTRANAAESEWRGDTVTLTGNLEVTRGNMKLTADGGQLDRSRNLVKLRGAVEIRQPGLVLTGDAADIVTGSGQGDVLNARFLAYETGARGTAAVLTRAADDVLELEEASYTQCSPDDEDWQLRARHITLNRATGRGLARGTTLRVGNIPVFYTPYMNFPIDDRRQTGFLWPTIATSDGGLDLSAPLYLNLAANYDATLAPRYIASRGAMLESELRYLNRYSNWRFAGAYLPDDDDYGDDRWLGGVYQAGRYGPFSTGIDYTRVSDHDYFEDLSLSSLDVRRQTHLAQSAWSDFYHEQWSARILVEQFQVIDLFVAEPYRKLPQISVSRMGGGTNFNLDYSLYAEATAFENRDSIGDGGPFVTGNRFYAEPGISFPMRWRAGYIEPALRLRHVSYDLKDTRPGASRTPSATVPLAIVDAGLFFERELSAGYYQTLEPRFYYLHSDFDDQTDQPIFDTSPVTFNYQQLFSSRRFVGRDRLEDFDQLSTGLTSRYISPTGREILSASIGQIIYFDDRQITLLNLPGNEPERSRSNVAAQLNWQPSDPVWATANALWDPDRGAVDQGSFYLHYEPDGRALYNFGYRYRRETLEIVTLSEEIDQLDASTVLPLSNRWRLFARWNYDLNDNRSIENLFGLEYEDCCWRVRMAYQAAIDGEELDELGIVRGKEDEVFLLEFQLKGLGSIGQKMSGMLEESIWGYRERE